MPEKEEKPVVYTGMQYQIKAAQEQEARAKAGKPEEVKPEVQTAKDRESKVDESRKLK